MVCSCHTFSEALLGDHPSTSWTVWAELKTIYSYNNRLIWVYKKRYLFFCRFYHVSKPGPQDVEIMPSCSTHRWYDMEVFKKILGILFVWLNFYNKDLGEKTLSMQKNVLKSNWVRSISLSKYKMYENLQITEGGTITSNMRKVLGVSK